MRAWSLLAMVLASAAPAADWPQFRGPNGAGISPDPVPVTWSDTENLRWKTPLPGAGSSSPVVVGDRVFITCYTGKPSGSEPLARHLLCLNRVDGKALWKSTVPGYSPEDAFTGFITEHGYASSTPASDGERVYCFFGKSGVVAYDFTGKELWKTSVGVESDARRWGSGASVVLSGDRVIVNAASESESVRALDKRTGKQLWKAEGATLSLSYSTPALVKAGDHEEVCVAAPGELWGLDTQTGKLRWYAPTPTGGNVSPSAVASDGIVYVTGGFSQRGTTAIKAGGKGDAKSNVSWTAKSSSYVPTPLLHAGRLFWIGDTGNASCLDATTGKSLFVDERVPLGASDRGGRPFYASPILAGGKIYAQARRAGLFVIEPGDKFMILHHNKLNDDTDFNATPAAVGGQLFLRSNAAVYCIEANRH